MSEITIRDLSEVKELNEQVMIATVGGRGWAVEQYVRKYPRRGKKYGPKMHVPYAYGRHGFRPLSLDINTQTQVITVANSFGTNITAVQTNA